MLNMRRFAAAATLSAMMVSGNACALTARVNTQMQPWVGHSSTELVTSWGPPTSSQEIGGGQRVLTGRIWNPRGTGGYWTMRMFAVNSEGTIQAYSWRGL